ncbi:class F sortase [Streptomyces sp. NPDC087440]|uniref:class F sortase n=1 Tax=Streptomyces sp. NPDC087440 TaxID=3365790 RepID=UPI00380F5306
MPTLRMPVFRAPRLPRPPAASPRFRTHCAVLVLAVLTGVWLIRGGTSPATAPPQPSAAEAFAPLRADRAGGARERPAVAPLPASEPVRLRIPQIRVDTPVMRLGLDSAGSLDVPPEGNPNIAGWYKDGTPPGAPGTAVVAGHVDTADGPAVFYRLGSLRKGHTVEVLRKDGRTAVFTIDAIEVYDAADFPDSKVYGKAARPELRVITCGGGFVEGKGYRGNVVVFAHLTGVRAVTHHAAPDTVTPPTGRTPASQPA